MFNLDEIYSVSGFLSLCNKTIENHIPTCWLQGEISNLSRPTSGHWYFSLKDNRGQIRCALFRLNQRNIKFTPENGMEVLLRAGATLYEMRGDFQLIVQHMEPMGAGNLNLAFEQLKSQLNEQGLFDPIHKKNLPSQPKTIGVVSSSTGAVIQDIIKVLNKRYPFVDILLFDTVVQGNLATDKIVSALHAADKNTLCDIIILARGGGSLEDLWAFNEESVARAIFNAKTPIISAIGHETDTTIADFVSDVRAPTPSAAASLATPDKLALLSQTDKLKARLKQSILTQVKYQSSQLTQLTNRLSTPHKHIHFFAQKLDYLNANLQRQSKNILVKNKIQLQFLSTKLGQYSPIVRVNRAQMRSQQANEKLLKFMQKNLTLQQTTLNKQQQALHAFVQKTLEKHKTKLSLCANALDYLSPLSTLERGYSISSSENTVLNSVNSVKIQQSLLTRLADGKIYSRIEKIEKN
jgi:exodeoxyribonuclease VII large subunit